MRYAQFTHDTIAAGKKPTMVREYQISAIGRYMIDPKALVVEKTLVGCEIHRRSSMSMFWKKLILGRFRKKSLNLGSPKTLWLDFVKPRQRLTDEVLDCYIGDIYNKLKAVDSFYDQLDKIDLSRVVDVVGVCEDNAGFKSAMVIDGDPIRQFDYIRKNCGQKIKVKLKKAYAAKGVFEMNGFDFKTFDPGMSYRLIRMTLDGKNRACLLGNDNTIAFWLNDVNLLSYLQLFEYAIRENNSMKESLEHCIQGKALPVRLMFNHTIEIDYTNVPLPPVWQEAIKDIPLEVEDSMMIKQKLNAHQLGVSFNSISNQSNLNGEICTDISILQNLCALEPIKDRIPTLFEELNKRAARFDTGIYYQLDAIRGV
ncbi:MAG: hypothetical protein GY874_12540 [Desulfobacteraceae bacterium]|nr:hypothetical protein [Desulfobacteraceae bacterium]